MTRDVVGGGRLEGAVRGGPDVHGTRRREQGARVGGGVQQGPRVQVGRGVQQWNRQLDGWPVARLCQVQRQVGVALLGDHWRCEGQLGRGV